MRPLNSGGLRLVATPLSGHLSFPGVRAWGQPRGGPDPPEQRRRGMKFSSSSLPLGQGFVNKRVRAILRHDPSDTLKKDHPGRRFNPTTATSRTQLIRDASRREATGCGRAQRRPIGREEAECWVESRRYQIQWSGKQRCSDSNCAFLCLLAVLLLLSQSLTCLIYSSLGRAGFKLLSWSYPATQARSLRPSSTQPEI